MGQLKKHLKNFSAPSVAEFTMSLTSGLPLRFGCHARHLAVEANVKARIGKKESIILP